MSIKKNVLIIDREKESNESDETSVSVTSLWWCNQRDKLATRGVKVRKDICTTQKYKGTDISLEFISCKEMERERKAWLCWEVSHLLFQVLQSQNVCNFRFTFPTQFNLVQNSFTSLLFCIWMFSQPLSLLLSLSKRRNSSSYLPIQILYLW